MTTSPVSHKVSTSTASTNAYNAVNPRSTSLHLVFSVIFSAFEILGNSSRRHAYDSVDPFLPNSEPSLEEIKMDFFGTLNKFFMEKARWSKHQPTPFLGHRRSPIDHVHRFYDFWLVWFSSYLVLIILLCVDIFLFLRGEYETTKDFSFLDEEDKEKGEE